MTWLLLGAMFAVWFVVQGGGIDPVRARHQRLQLWNGARRADASRARSAPACRSVRVSPASSTTQPINIFTPLTSMFLHGGWGHILGNAIFFWVFGNNIEDSMGPGRFLVFYLLCGLIAAAAHVLLSPTSPVPTVGASGAISGVLGAYLVLYPRVRVNMLFIFVIFFRVFAIPAWACCCGGSACRCSRRT